MKPTGIVRRVDDLGRVVIPKEVRKTLHIDDGDPLELFTDGADIVLKKYGPFEEITAIQNAIDFIMSFGTIDPDRKKKAIAKLEEAMAILNAEIEKGDDLQ